MCPYYLDGDLTELESPVGDTRCHRGLSLRGGCGYCAVFKGRREGAGPDGRHGGRPTGTGLSKLNSMLRPRSSAICRATREAPRPLADARQRSGRPGSVDVLAARPVAGGEGRDDEGHDRPHGAVPHMPHTGLPRKEVIQPHLPVRLPCYDFTPVTSPTFDGSLPQGVRPPASGVAHSRGVTGGVYKARERIHRGSADPRLLATPPSCRRVSACNPNRDAL
jgi:hypothetical protein